MAFCFTFVFGHSPSRQIFFLSTNASFRRAQTRRSAYLRHASYNVFSNTRDEVGSFRRARPPLSVGNVLQKYEDYTRSISAVFHFTTRYSAAC